MTCCSGSSVSSASETTKALLLVLLDRRVGLDVLLELLVGDVGQDLLAVGADDLGDVRRPAGGRSRPSWPGSPWRGLLRRGGVLGLTGGRGRCAGGLLGRRLLGRGLGRRRRRVRRGGRRAGRADRAGTEMPRALRCASSALRWRGSTAASSLARRTSSGVTSRSGAALDQGDDGGVGRAPQRGALARVRGHEHLSSNNIRGAARPGVVKSRVRHSATPIHGPRPSPHPSGCRPALTRLRGGLLRLLEVAHLLQRRRVDHVGHRAVARPARSPRPPASQPSGRTSSCLASSATKIWAFCLPNPGSAITRFSRSGRRRRLGPEPLGVAVVLLLDDRGQLLQPGRPSTPGTGGSPAASSTAPRTPRGRPPRSLAGLERPEPVQHLRRARGTRAPSGTAGRASCRPAARTGLSVRTWSRPARHR